MSIQKNEIPILEYDTDPSAVLMPTQFSPHLQLPKKAVFAFLGEQIDKYAKAQKAVRVGRIVTATKIFPVYVVKHQGEDVCLCQAPVGAAPAAQMLDFLIGHGAREIISGGGCGALCSFAENVFLVPYKALRDEGTSYHYMRPSRYVEINGTARKAIEKTLAEHGLPYREVFTWTTDGFYRETREKVLYRRQEGCEAVEMECAALAACAALRGAIWGCILFTEDTLADVEKYDARHWGADSFSHALTLCLDAVVRIPAEKFTGSSSAGPHSRLTDA